MSWYWKSDLRKGDDDDEAWTPYAQAQCDVLEKALRQKKKEIEMAPHVVNLKGMYQYRKGDHERQRTVKRVEEEDSDDSDEPKLKGPQTKRQKTMGVRDKSFARSGTFSSNKKISDTISKLGGICVSSVTKDIDYLLCAADSDLDTLKAGQARKFRIPIAFIDSDFPTTNNPEQELKDALKPNNMKFTE
ncbi:hypothetical protein DIPPA_31743 [Diplonema papillatum]|nr:hypothetical protein DIPPA_31743 [Diplonema papillatum]|eukprot:gene2146-3292_t